MKQSANIQTRSWGNFPSIAKRHTVFSENLSLSHNNIIARGNARSYGDSALAENMLDMRKHNLMLSFDESSGILHCQSGTLLADIITTFLPRGWFPLVSPGTKFITIGGAIASDVHGKNHHKVGSFSECVIDFSLQIPNGTVLTCSKKDNAEFFHATLGGMGLTGVILDATIQLQKVQSQFIEQRTIKTTNLLETFEQFEKHKDSTYSVAWIDCLAKKSAIGRSIITLGEHAHDNNLAYQQKNKLPFPMYAPSFCINTLSIKIFNFLYYQRILKKDSVQQVSIDSFFYPLDGISNWNRAYGKQGFLQYQFVLPIENSYDGMLAVLQEISKSGLGSILTVLKLMGDENQNYLSFPKKGYTLAIDFKNDLKSKKLFETLDKLIIHYGGRFYLAKDARIAKEVFELGYPHIHRFREFRKEQQLSEHFNSLQSQRLSL